MACIWNTEYVLGCRQNTGGTQLIALASFDQGVTYSYDVNAVITSTSYATGSFYSFEQYTEQATLNAEVGADNNVGTVNNTQNLTIIMETMDADTRAKFLILTQGRFRAIVRLQSGVYIYMGRNNGARMSAGSTGPGKASLDLQGYTATLTAVEPEPFHIITEAEALRLISVA